MRVLHICQRDDPETGGSIRVAEALIREQRMAGIDAWVLFLYGPAGCITEEFSETSLCLALRSSHQAFSGIRCLARSIKQVAPDIIHSHDGILWPRLAYLRLKIPVVTHAHLPAGDPSLVKRLLGWPLIKRTSSRVIGISQHTARSWMISGYPAKHIAEIPNGVDFGRFNIVSSATRESLRNKLGLPCEKHVVLWLGRLHRDMKGTDRVEKVAELLPDGHVLVVVGNGPEYEGMVSRCAEQLASGKLILAGSTGSPVEYYQMADSFLFTSYYEPFGLVILEAIACGLPILAFPVTRGGGAVELLKAFNALEVEDDCSRDSLKERLSQLPVRKENAVELREKAKEKYSWTTVSKQTVELYVELLAGGAR